MDELWDEITLSLSRDYVITAACFVEHQGLQAGYGYIVKGFTSAKDGTRLLKVKSPWKKDSNQNKEWTGRFSQVDNSIPSDLKKQLKKGEFFMSVEDFKTSFKYFTTVYLDKNK